jgi:hypothetical protein
MRKLVEGIVDFAARHALAVVAVALLTVAGTWTYAAHLDLRSDFLELLPRDSPGFKAFEHQLGRTGGNASLFVMVESPDRAANERFIDAISAEVEAMIAEHAACQKSCGADPAACRQKCGPDLVSYIETGTKEVRRFFDANKWLYADLDDLEHADATLDHQIAIRSGLVSDLDDEPTPPQPTPPPRGVAAPVSGAVPPPAPPPRDEKPALGLDDYYQRWKDRANRRDDFPTGYFATPDGKMMGVRIVSPGTGMGDRGGDLLLEKVKELVAKLNPKALSPAMEVGYAGDIPNAIEEKDSLVSDAFWASGVAAVLILGGVVLFFRSFWSLLVISLPAFIGVGCAYSFAMARYGYVNTSGAFLGAIILGNGINYPIVLLARYREFRARGQARDAARRDAVWNAFRAELVGAFVGAIAYGSLVVTRFRGFSQFGMIGFVGMILVWIAMIPCVPALLVVLERIQERLPPWLRDPPPRVADDGRPGHSSRVLRDRARPVGHPRARRRGLDRRRVEAPYLPARSVGVRLPQPGLEGLPEERRRRVVQQGRSRLRREDERRRRPDARRHPRAGPAHQAADPRERRRRPQGPAHRRGGDDRRPDARHGRRAAPQARGPRAHP